MTMLYYLKGDVIMEELTTREWDLIYDAIQYRIDNLEDLLEIQTVDRFKNRILGKIKELEVIQGKIGEKTV